MIVLIVSINNSLQDFTLNFVFLKFWFSVFIATNVWIKSKVLDTGLWNFYHLFFVILSVLVDMKNTQAKKIITIFFKIFWDIFIYYLILLATFFQSSYIIFHNKKVATHFKEQNKKKNHDNWLKNKKVIQSKKCPKNAQKTRNLCFKNT